MIGHPESEGRGTEPLFSPGRLVHHKRYHYRGVVVALDRTCSANDAWYRSNQTQPDRDQPWYHVLVHAATLTTYVAQSNLEPDGERGPVDHPLIESFFSGFQDGVYVRNEQPWIT